MFSLSIECRGKAPVARKKKRSMATRLIGLRPATASNGRFRRQSGRKNIPGSPFSVLLLLFCVFHSLIDDLNYCVSYLHWTTGERSALSGAATFLVKAAVSDWFHKIPFFPLCFHRRH